MVWTFRLYHEKCSYLRTLSSGERILRLIHLSVVLAPLGDNGCEMSYDIDDIPLGILICPWSLYFLCLQDLDFWH